MDITEPLARLYAKLTPVSGLLHGREERLNLGDPEGEAEALAATVAVANLSSRTRVELRGADRAAFLHNLCTQEIRRRAAGEGCEAMLLDAHGRVIAYVYVYLRDESILLETVPGQGASLIAHLDRYLIRERVELVDRSSELGELLLAGPEAEALLASLGPPPPSYDMACCDTTLAGQEVFISRTPLVRAPAFLVMALPVVLETVGPALVAAGARPVGMAAVEAERIAAGSPWYGVDLHAKTLPQELARDARTISFTKGCYIGQETVARLDALGHVNKTLCGLQFSSSVVPDPGTLLTREGQEVGQVTSAAMVARLQCVLALGFVRREAHAPDTILDSVVGPARVVQLPL